MNGRLIMKLTRFFLKYYFSIIFLFLAFSLYAADSMNPTGDSVGGGAGYSRQVDLNSTQQTYKVSSVDELVFAVAKAGNGDIVYVEDTAELDLSGITISIAAGVTLSSGRGGRSSSGALLYSDKLRTLPLIKITGDNVRVTGLRLRGPDPERRTEQMTKLIKEGKFYTVPNSRGISSAFDSLEVDNCELWGWSHAAIRLVNGAKAYIHHNFIHHNQRHGLGYGVILEEASALIEANLFDWNRHSIAGTGRPGTSFEARYNVVLEHANSHAFDMHGGADRKDGTNIAGDEINIHHNDFLLAADVIDIHGAVVIRGLPRIGATIHHNIFRNLHDLKKAVWQKNKVGMIRVYENEYPLCD